MGGVGNDPSDAIELTERLRSLLSSLSSSVGVGGLGETGLEKYAGGCGCGAGSAGVPARDAWAGVGDRRVSAAGWAASSEVTLLDAAKSPSAVELGNDALLVASIVSGRAGGTGPDQLPAQTSFQER